MYLVTSEADIIPQTKQESIIQENQTIQINQTNQTAPSIFSDEPALKLCSANVCANGHLWMPKVMLVKCPGCSGPVLAIKMEQCPVCNEPTQRLSLRTDHVAQQHGILAMCKGAQSNGEIGIIELERNHATEIEEKFPNGNAKNLNAEIIAT